MKHNQLSLVIVQALDDIDTVPQTHLQSSIDQSVMNTERLSVYVNLSSSDDT